MCLPDKQVYSIQHNVDECTAQCSTQAREDGEVYRHEFVRIALWILNQQNAFDSWPSPVSLLWNRGTVWPPAIGMSIFHHCLLVANVNERCPNSFEQMCSRGANGCEINHLSDTTNPWLWQWRTCWLEILKCGLLVKTEPDYLMTSFDWIRITRTVLLLCRCLICRQELRLPFCCTVTIWVHKKAIFIEMGKALMVIFFWSCQVIQIVIMQVVVLMV